MIFSENRYPLFRIMPKRAETYEQRSSLARRALAAKVVIPCQRMQPVIAPVEGAGPVGPRPGMTQSKSPGKNPGFPLHATKVRTRSQNRQLRRPC
jgi:hypothetical protein